MVLTSLVVEDKSEAYSAGYENPDPMNVDIQENGRIHSEFASQAKTACPDSPEAFLTI